MKLILLAAVAACAAPAAAAQTSTKLTKPAAEFPDPFTQVTSIRELPGGKVLVTDRQDKIVQLVDLASGSARKVGREGKGPGEYSLPGTLLPLPGGKTLVHDMLASRFLEIGADGATGGTVSLPGADGRGGRMMVSLGNQLADAKGRVYMQAPPFDPTDPEVSHDSVPILRWDRVKPMFDTVAWIGVPKTNVQASGSGGRMNIRIGMAKVFESQEAWGVAGDGSVARVTPEPYRVLWYGADGRPAAGPAVPWTPIRVTEADKQEVIEARKRARPMFVAIDGGGNRSASSGAFQVPDPEFADTKPPFASNNGVLVAPDGEVWVRKNQKAGSRNPVYDVFDRTGRIARTVTLEPRSRVVGFGEQSVYVARMDEDDLEYLQRFTR